MKVTVYNLKGEVIDPSKVKVPKEIREQISRIINKRDVKKGQKKDNFII